MTLDEKAVLSAYGRLMASRRRSKTQTCPVCGAGFTGLNRARYCSDRCRVAAFRERERKSASGGE